jgi:hypothetical protein
MFISRYSTFLLACLASVNATNPFAAKQTPSDAKSQYMANLLRKAVPTENSHIGRDLAENNAQVEIDLSSYSLRFEKCQFVKAYNQDLADAGASTVLATQRFVLFRLCPSGNCNRCNSKYGEYMIDMGDYLQTTVEFRKQEQEEMCNTCQESCQYYQNQQQDQQGEQYYAADDNAAQDAGGRRLSVDCTTCTSDCSKIANMEANYYLDATNFINCQKISDNYNGYGAALYAGPICASQGTKIKIGVFTDDECMFLDTSKDVESYLADENGNAMKLSHALLKTTYDSSDCISCAESVANGNGYYTTQTKEVCGTLYQASAKCESIHGFQALTSNKYYDYNNQVDNEDLVCDLISSLKSGTYSQEGEIVVGGSRLYRAGGTSTTGGQKFALTFFIIGTVGLSVYAAMLHSQLTKGSRANLSSQGGAMA